MRYHYVWLFWSVAFLVPWVLLFVATPQRRRVMWLTSAATTLLGLTEPIFVPRYWNPPSLFELAQRTGFDIESLIFTFAIGGIGAAFYDSVMRRALVAIGSDERQRPRHRLHRAALAVPFVLFVPLYFLPWNPIYPGLACLAVGAVASATCRPDLIGKTVFGGVLFGALYTVFMLALRVFTPGYIAAVWNLPALSGLLVVGVPVEEIAFGFAFGMYWAAIYEHVAWRGSAMRDGFAVNDMPARTNRTHSH